MAVLPTQIDYSVLPVAQAISSARTAAQYIQTTYQIPYIVEFCLYVSLLVVGILTLKGQLSPALGISALLASVIGIPLLLHLAQSMVQHFRKPKSDAYQEELRNLGTHPRLDEIPNLIDEEAAKQIQAKTHGIAITLKVLSALAIIIFAILVVNQYFSAPQLRVVSGSILVSVGALQGLMCYLLYRAENRADNHHIEFILRHYKLGDPVVEEALQQEANLREPHRQQSR